MLVGSPPIVGVILIGLIVFGEVDEHLLDSGVAMAAGLLVGAMLILVPPTLYAKSPELHQAYQEALEKEVAAVEKRVRADLAGR